MNDQGCFASNCTLVHPSASGAAPCPWCGMLTYMDLIFICNVGEKAVHGMWQCWAVSAHPVLGWDGLSFRRMCLLFDGRWCCSVTCTGTAANMGYSCMAVSARLGTAYPAGSGWPVPGSIGGVPGVPIKLQEHILPLMLAINAPDLFSYPSCNFKVRFEHRNMTIRAADWPAAWPCLVLQSVAGQPCRGRRSSCG